MELQPAGYTCPVPELPENTLIVFVSDSHIGGDPGCDGFESPAGLQNLFEELAAMERPVELILAGDFNPSQPGSPPMWGSGTKTFCVFSGSSGTWHV